MKIFYEEENIRAIAEKIRDKANVDTTYTTAEMPSGVDEVYNKGYADGEANGTGGIATPVLYGTHILVKGQSSYEEPASTVSQELTNVRGWFYNGETVYQSNISKIELANKSIFIYASDGYGKISNVWDKWYFEYNGTEGFFPTNDERCRVIEFRNPNEVSQAFYDLFMAIVNNSTSTTPYSVGEEVGKQAQHNEFWDDYLKNGVKPYHFASAGWNDDTFYPDRDLKPVENCYNLFATCGISDLAGRLRECGVTLDTSGINQRCDYMFGYASSLTTVPYLDLRNASYASGTFNNMFNYCTALHTIEGIHLAEDGSQILGSAIFNKCNALVNLTFYGKIGSSGITLQYSIELSQDSIISVLNALSDSTSGLSITLSLKAVNKAFTNGVNSSLWQEWVHDKSNWTINLV